MMNLMMDLMMNLMMNLMMDLMMNLMMNLQKLRGQTGFTAIEVFRKYLWFLLRERQFDAAAVEDMVALKGALGLTDDDVRRGVRRAGCEEGWYM
jgi:hypothetical protein